MTNQPKPGEHPADAKPADAIVTRLDLSPTDHERLREAAHKLRVSMSVLARRCVVDTLDAMEVKWPSYPTEP